MIEAFVGLLINENIFKSKTKMVSLWGSEKEGETGLTGELRPQMILQIQCPVI